MYILYLDEFGHPGPYDPADPSAGHHPLFGFAGFAIPSDEVRGFDRSFLRRKQSFYSKEIGDSDDRSERYEPKRITGRRDMRFAQEVVYRISEWGGFLFATGCQKTTRTPQEHSRKGLYTSTVQASLRSFERYLRDGPDEGVARGMVIMDRRQQRANLRVLEAAQTHLFSHEYFRRENVGISETPVLVHSHWYHGIQAAHVIGQLVGKIYWYRRLGESRFKKFEDHLGGVLDSAAQHMGGWSSIYIWAD